MNEATRPAIRAVALQVAMGHDVTLFASGDLVTTAEVEAAWPQALRLDPSIRDTTAPHMLLMEAGRRRVAEFDIMHFHVDYWPFSLFTALVHGCPGSLTLMDQVCSHHAIQA